MEREKINPNMIAKARLYKINEYFIGQCKPFIVLDMIQSSGRLGGYYPVTQQYETDEEAELKFNEITKDYLSL